MPKKYSKPAHQTIEQQFGLPPTYHAVNDIKGYIGGDHWHLKRMRSRVSGEDIWAYSYAGGRWERTTHQEFVHLAQCILELRLTTVAAETVTPLTPR